jgi:hypothetical protein
MKKGDRLDNWYVTARYAQRALPRMIVIGRRYERAVRGGMYWGANTNETPL